MWKSKGYWTVGGQDPLRENVAWLRHCGLEIVHFSAEFENELVDWSRTLEQSEAGTLRLKLWKPWRELRAKMIAQKDFVQQIAKDPRSGWSKSLELAQERVPTYRVGQRLWCREHCRYEWTQGVVASVERGMPHRYEVTCDGQREGKRGTLEVWEIDGHLAACEVLDFTPDVVAKAGNIDQDAVKAIGNELRALKERLASKGVTGKKLSVHRKFRELAEKFAAITGRGSAEAPHWSTSDSLKQPVEKTIDGKPATGTIEGSLCSPGSATAAAPAATAAAQ